LSGKPKILAMDDDKGILRALSLILDHEGYEVDTPETGREALEKTDLKTYNAVMLDFRLPDTDGAQLLWCIKDTVPKIRKIMLTGFPSMSNAVDSVNFGADALIVKPCGTAKVISIIKERLKKQEGERQYLHQKVAQYIETLFRATPR